MKKNLQHPSTSEMSLSRVESRILQVKSVFSFRQEVIACLKELAKLYLDEVMEAVVLSKLQLHQGNDYHNVIV
jgi:hypothetical protein